jgi:predicted Fe-Mo cluster-binding NifX family protein
MKIAVAVTAAYARVTGHAGRARRWIVFEIDDQGRLLGLRRVLLEPKAVFHHHDREAPHPLDGVDAVIAGSAGEGFITKMERRGIHAALTAEPDPARAAADLVAGRLKPPRPRPIGALMCKTVDLFSGHHD